MANGNEPSPAERNLEREIERQDGDPTALISAMALLTLEIARDTRYMRPKVEWHDRVIWALVGAFLLFGVPSIVSWIESIAKAATGG